ncbi:MAG: hypothetical protein AB7U85_10410 [Alphaproteobacteria bacterium]
MPNSEDVFNGANTAYETFSMIDMIKNIADNFFKAEDKAYDCIFKDQGKGSNCDKANGRYRKLPKGDYEEKDDKDSSNINEKQINNFVRNNNASFNEIMDPFRKGVYSKVDKAEKILSKSPFEISEREMKDAKNFVATNLYHPKREDVDKHVQHYFEHHYQEGKEIPVNNNPESVARYRKQDGGLVDNDLDIVLMKSGLSSKDGNNVKNLQRALNLLDNFSSLKEDNIFGNKTATNLFSSIRKHGARKIEKAFDSL